MITPIKKTFTDQLGREININFPPTRIVSLVPSQTELLFDLGLAEKIVGITKFCVHPAEKTSVSKKVGGTKKLDLELIRSLQPDLVFANKEENEKSQVEELMQHFPVWVSDVNDLESALDMIIKVGEITGTLLKAKAIANQIHTYFNSLMPLKKQTVAYFIWRKPYMLAGSGTFIDNMLAKCGLGNAITKSRYPEVAVDELVTLNPHLVFLSSEPYPFKQQHVNELQSILPDAKILLVDGEMFSWYGSRLLKAVPYFKGLLKHISS